MYKVHIPFGTIALQSLNSITYIITDNHGCVNYYLYVSINIAHYQQLLIFTDFPFSVPAGDGFFYFKTGPFQVSLAK